MLTFHDQTEACFWRSLRYINQCLLMSHKVSLLLVLQLTQFSNITRFWEQNNQPFPCIQLYDTKLQELVVYNTSADWEFTTMPAN